MKYYHTSTGERVSKSVVDRRVTEAKRLKIETMKDEFGYIFCEECHINSSTGIPLDCSHNVSVNEAQKTGKTELSWAVNNITIRCRNCHHEHDHKSKFN